MQPRNTIVGCTFAVALGVIAACSDSGDSNSTRVPLAERYELSSEDSVRSPDGLAVLGDDLYTVADRGVSRVRLATDFRSGEVVTVPQISGLSTAAVAEDQLYVIKSEVLNFVLNQPLDTPFEIFRVDVDAFDQQVWNQCFFSLASTQASNAHPAPTISAGNICAMSAWAGSYMQAICI
jgi:hypothetical protein